MVAEVIGHEPITKRFALAGAAVFTVSNPAGERYTFRISKKDGRNGDGPVWFAAWLSGPDNEADYSYLGMVSPADGTLRATKASKAREDSRVFRVAVWALGVLWGRATLPDGYWLEHAGQCARCGRMLTVPESIRSGFGPECYGRLQ